MITKFFARFTAFVAILGLAIGTASAREQIKIVGSSTVFPFSTAVAEQFGQKSSFDTPVVESTGSGGGLKLFCAGVGENHPDITNASRRIKKKEFDQCIANGITPIEVKIGFDGIVVANTKSGEDFQLTLEQIFLALGKEVPVNGKLVANPYTKWSEIDPALPNIAIEVLGPPPTSGTRDAFNEIAMVGGCEVVIENTGVEIEEKHCEEIREDGFYIEAGENDNLIVQKLEANPNAVGVFGFSFLDQNADKIKGASIDGVQPEFEEIADGNYPISRSLYFYIKKEHVGVIPGIEQFVAEFTNEGTWGDDGYLADKGLIPLSSANRNQVGSEARSLTPLSM